MAGMAQPLFPEENLLLTKEQGYGFFPAEPGLKLLNNTFRIIRKLRRGDSSSTWLAQRTSNDDAGSKYYALKILTAHATESRNSQDPTDELNLMDRFASDPANKFPFRRDAFEIDGPHGRHLCLVLELHSTDATTFKISSPTKSLPLHTVQFIITEVLACLKTLHNNHFVHTDVKPENMLFLGPGDDAVDAQLQHAYPAEVGRFRLGGFEYCMMLSQPLMPGTRWDDTRGKVEDYAVDLCGFGHVQQLKQQLFRDDIVIHCDVVTQRHLRAPELILRTGFDSKVDIWAIGCITYELLTGKVLFNLKTEEESSAEEMVHLAQMTQIAGETFKKDAKKLLKKSTVRERYFDDKGDLRQAMEKGVNNSMEDALKEVLDPDRVDHTMKFIRSCLRLDPQLRPSAVELAISDWLSNALIAGDYRPPKDRFGTEVGSRVSLEKLME